MTAFTLYLLRHGEPEGAGRMLGRSDAAPTCAGIDACLARVRDLDVQILIASDLSRARLAGEAIGHAAGVPLSIDPRWRELDFGAWDGLAPEEIDSHALARFWDDPNEYAPPGGETWAALVERVSAAMRDMAAQPTLIVTHGGAMRAALAAACGFDLRQGWALDLPYNSLLCLRVWPATESDRSPTAQITGLFP